MRWVVGSILDGGSISRSSQCSTTGVSAIMSVVMVHIKEDTCCSSESVAHVAAAGFLSRYLNGSLPYLRRHMIVNKNVLDASLNKTFPSFLTVYI